MEIEIADVMKRIGDSEKRNKQKEATTFAVASFVCGSTRIRT